MTGAFEIGPFRLDLRAQVVLHEGVAVPLGARAVAVLGALVERANEHVPKAALVEAAWPGLVVEDGNLAVQISAIRKVFCRVPGGERWVETLARRGYRFVGPVALLPAPDSTRGAQGIRLPQRLTAFVGRDAALEELRGMLRDARLLTISGTGGIGKTRLALQVAQDRAPSHRDGVVFVDLAPLADATLVPSAVAQALGLGETRGGGLLASLCAHLAACEMLIVLDNCEHVLDGAALAAETLLHHIPGITILATSREPLQVTGEQVYPLDPLSIPRAGGGMEDVRSSEAGRLFLDCVGRQQPGYEPTSKEAALIAQVCGQLDGIPLAIELAAARTRSLSLAQIKERLDDRFQLLTGGTRSAPARQKTMRATLDWSHELLGEDERILLARCAVFVGGFTLEAAQSIAGDLSGAVPVADALAQLVARSLVQATTRGNAARYGMLETTRAYALERLEASGEAEATRARHARRYRDEMVRASDEWLRISDAQWHAAHVGELGNVRAALDWALGDRGDAGIAVALAGASGSLWTRLSLEVEGLARLRAGLALEATSDSLADRARLWLWFGILAEGDPVEARAAHRRAAGFYRELGDAGGLGFALLREGRMLLTMGEADAAEAVLSESLVPLQASFTPKAMGLYWGDLGYLRMRQGDLAGARDCFGKALDLHREAGAEYSVMAMLGYLADLAWQQGDLPAAAAAFRENIALLKGLPRPRRSFLGVALGNLTGVLTEMGELEEALAVAREGLPLMRESGFAWNTMDHCALRAAFAGKVGNAARLSGYTDAAYAKRSARREPNEARALERLVPLLSQAFSIEERLALREQGSALDDAAACRLAVD